MLKKTILLLFLLTNSICSEKNEDKLKLAIESSFTYIKENPIKTLLVGGATVATVGFGISFYKQYQNMKADLDNEKRKTQQLNRDLDNLVNNNVQSMNDYYELKGILQEGARIPDGLRVKHGI
jgi:hypothetical protein